MKDRHNRTIDYLRIAVTDRCNLRCFYCMPEKGINYVSRSELLSFEELLRISKLFIENGIRKIRITGGEPLLRKDLMDFLEKLSEFQGLEEINLTTNGTITGKYLAELKKLGIGKINLSLDSLDKDRFKEITRRDQFDQVMACFYKMIDLDFEVKLNCVVMEDHNIEDIHPFIELTRVLPVSVRFIEEMPFNGIGKVVEKPEWNYKKIYEHISAKYSQIEKIDDLPNSTSTNYRVAGFKGSFGIIPAYSRTFCGSCNRIRLTPKGQIKTCLYDQGIFDIKKMIRSGATDEQLQVAIIEAVEGKAKDGFEAERARGSSLPVSESMSTIGG